MRQGCAQHQHSVLEYSAPAPGVCALALEVFPAIRRGALRQHKRLANKSAGVQSVRRRYRARVSSVCPGTTVRRLRREVHGVGSSANRDGRRGAVQHCLVVYEEFSEGNQSPTSFKCTHCSWDAVERIWIGQHLVFVTCLHLDAGAASATGANLNSCGQRHFVSAFASGHHCTAARRECQCTLHGCEFIRTRSWPARSVVKEFQEVSKCTARALCSLLGWVSFQPPLSV